MAAEFAGGVTAVVPTLNEAANVSRLLDALAGALAALPGPAEIVLVDDGSADGTAELAEERGKGLPVRLRVLRRRGKRSLSGSVVDGARAARFKTVVVLDADLSHDPGELARLVLPVERDSFDLAVASRYAPGGKIGEWPLGRRLLSRLGTAVASQIAGIRDPLSGYFACRRALLDGTGARVRPRGYKILLEVLGRNPHLRALEVPTAFADRSAGRSKLRLRQLVEFAIQLGSLVISRLALRLGVGRRLTDRRLEHA